MKRSRLIAFTIICILLAPLSGCSRRGPVTVRFTRQVDAGKLEALPRLSGSVVLVVTSDFWTDRKRVERIPIARREKTFIIGPGAAAMAETMLNRMFSDVRRVRHADQMADAEPFDFAIRLVQDSFDDRTLFFPLFSNQRYRVDLGAEVSRLDLRRRVMPPAKWTESLRLRSPFQAANRRDRHRCESCHQTGRP